MRFATMPRVSPGWVQQSAELCRLPADQTGKSWTFRTASHSVKKKKTLWRFRSLYVCTYAGFHFNWWTSIHAQAFNSKDYVHLFVRRSVCEFIEKMDELLKCNRCVLKVTRRKENNHINCPGTLNTTVRHKQSSTRVWLKRYQTAKYSHCDVVLQSLSS